MSDDTIVFKPSGREKMRCTADGPTIYYTYADEDPQIPHGMRRCTFLEIDPYQGRIGMSDDLVEMLLRTSAGSGSPRELAAHRIKELNADLAKAMQALEKVQAFVRDLEPHADPRHVLVPALREACETLAELKKPPAHDAGG